MDEILCAVEISELKPRCAPPVSPSAPFSEVCRLLDEEYPSAIVIAEMGRVTGIFTERDILYRVAGEGIDPDTPVGELMTREPATLGPNDLLAEAIALMVEGGYRNVPLVDDQGQYAGMLSTRRVLGFIADHYPEAALNLPPRLHQRLTRPEGG